MNPFVIIFTVVPSSNSIKITCTKRFFFNRWEHFVHPCRIFEERFSPSSLAAIATSLVLLIFESLTSVVLARSCFSVSSLFEGDFDNPKAPHRRTSAAAPRRQREDPSGCLR